MQSRHEDRTSAPGRPPQPMRIDRWKYDAVRRASLGSVGWYTTSVKLDMEEKGDIRRAAGSKPQRLLRVTSPPGKEAS